MIKRQIKKAKERKRAVEFKRHELHINSAEYLAHEVASFSLAKRTVYDQDGDLLWDTDTDFIDFKEQYFPLLIFLVHAIMNEGVLDTDELREIARSPEWRLVWCLNRENLTGLFDCPIGDLTLNHKLLIYWSRVYDSALESPEPPDMEIINDDERFDDWLASRDLAIKEKTDKSPSGMQDHNEQMHVLDGTYIETCSCGAKERNVGVKGLGERERHQSDCLYGTYRQYTPEEKDKIARRIYGRNSNRVRKLLDKEQEVILKRGTVEDQYLRQNKTRQLLGMQTKVVSRK